MSGVRSYFTALQVSGRYGRATKLELEGRGDEALRIAREALSLLRAAHVVRDNPAEASLLVNLTVLAERLSVSLRQPGADDVDVHESVRALEKLAERGSTSDRQRRAEWLLFLRSRLQEAHGT
ncbi:MAG TPA: hypothetical protein VF713_18985 [Thermoanaerobaculia bacterium]